MNITEISSRLTLGVWRLWCARHEGRPDTEPGAYLEGYLDMLECMIPMKAMPEFDQVRGSVNTIVREMETLQKGWNVPLVQFRKRVGELLKVLEGEAVHGKY